MKSLRQQVQDLTNEVVGEIHHGECFYDTDTLDSLVEKLERLQALSTAYYNENQEEEED